MEASTPGSVPSADVSLALRVEALRLGADDLLIVRLWAGASPGEIRDASDMLERLGRPALVCVGEAVQFEVLPQGRDGVVVVRFSEPVSDFQRQIADDLVRRTWPEATPVVVGPEIADLVRWDLAGMNAKGWYHRSQDLELLTDLRDALADVRRLGAEGLRTLGMTSSAVDALVRRLEARLG